jgi:hypothetical protein
MINSRSSSKVGLGLVLTSKFKPTYPLTNQFKF